MNVFTIELKDNICHIGIFGHVCNECMQDKEFLWHSKLVFLLNCYIKYDEHYGMFVFLH